MSLATYVGVLLHLILPKFRPTEADIFEQTVLEELRAANQSNPVAQCLQAQVAQIDAVYFDTPFSRLAQAA